MRDIRRIHPELGISQIRDLSLCVLRQDEENLFFRVVLRPDTTRNETKLDTKRATYPRNSNHAHTARCISAGPVWLRVKV